jgi:hypothetical protein
MNDDEIKRKFAEDPDFVNLPKFGYSLQRALKRYPNGLPEELIAEALGTTVEGARARYNEVAAKLRAAVEAKHG